MSLFGEIFKAALEGELFIPKIGKSIHFKHWISIPSLTRCIICAKNHGQIWKLEEPVLNPPPIHPYCHCQIKNMETIQAGTATRNGNKGADLALLYTGILPDYYISKDEAKKSGWKPGEALDAYTPEKMLTGGLFYNRNNHLPTVPGRIWQEADINYSAGKRNGQRIVWSNDGLIFVTYDHYKTFYEITQEVTTWMD